MAKSLDWERMRKTRQTTAAINAARPRPKPSKPEWVDILVQYMNVRCLECHEDVYFADPAKWKKGVGVLHPDCYQDVIIRMVPAKVFLPTAYSKKQPHKQFRK